MSGNQQYETQFQCEEDKVASKLNKNIMIADMTIEHL